MIKKLCIIVFISLISLYGQNPGNIIWENKYGGDEYDEANAVVKTASGDYIAAGYTQSYGLGRWGNAYFVKVNKNGDSLWTKHFGWKGIDVFASLTNTSDGMFAAAGLTDTPENFENIYLVKIDEEGNLQWEKNYGGESKDVGLSVISVDDGGLIITGVTKSFGMGEEDLFILKTNINGDSLWFKTFGTTGNDGGYSVMETSDGGLIISGLYNWSDIWLLKTDANGDTAWTKIIGGTDYDEGISVLETNDKGFIICGSTASFGAGQLDAFVIRTDSLGNVQWQKTYGSFGYDEGRKIIKNGDGYLVLGNTDSGLAGELNYYLIWIDEAGDTLITKTYGDSGDDRCFDVIDIESHHFLIAGADFSQATFSDASLLMIESGNKTTGTKKEESVSEYFLSNAFPNPFNPSTKIKFNLPVNANISLKIFDILGNEVKTLLNEYKSKGEYDITFDASALASGTYYYRIESNGYSETKKILFVK